MPNRTSRTGGRMLNYFPVATRYRTSAALDDEGEWGAKLVGVFFVVLGVLTVASPALAALRTGTALLIGILGIPAWASHGDNPWMGLAVGVFLAAVGVGITLRKTWAHWAGMALAVALLVPAFPYVTIAGLLITFVLWRGRPRRGRSRPAS